MRHLHTVYGDHVRWRTRTQRAPGSIGARRLHRDRRAAQPRSPRHARQIYLQAGISHAMPPPNAIDMDDEPRRQIIAWYRQATGG